MSEELALPGAAAIVIVAVIAAVILLLLVVLAPLALFPGAFQSPESTQQLTDVVGIPAALVPDFNEASRVLHVNPYLLASIAKQESGFSLSDGKNGSGCAGLMQLGMDEACGDTWDESVRLTDGQGGSEGTVVVRDAYQRGTRPPGDGPAPYPASGPPSVTADLNGAVAASNDPFTAIMAAAVVLRAKVGGVPIPNLDQTAYAAACGYQGNCLENNYAPNVLAQARDWQSKAVLNVNASTVGAASTSGLYFPIQPESLAVVPSSWSLDAGVDVATLGEACYPQAAEVAIASGTIIKEGMPGFGPYAPVLQVDSGPLAGRSFYYGHAAPDAPHVTVGTHVQAGQVIAYVGCGIVGNSTGPHIEFGMYTPDGHFPPVFPAVGQTSSQVESLLQSLYKP